MKIETILNAFEIARARADWLSYTGIAKTKHYRQRLAFRRRIISMDAEKDDVIEGLFNSVDRQHKKIVMLRDKIQSLERAIIFRETGG